MRFEKQTNSKQLMILILDINILSLYKDSKNTIWIGTNVGLYKYKMAL